MPVLSYVLSLLGLAAMIAASLTRGEKMKLILLLVFFGNVLVATSYLADGSGISGAVTCYLGAVQVLINYFFQSKGRDIPKWLLAIYAVSFVALNIWAARGISPEVALVSVASLSFIMGIVQKTGAKYRFWTVINVLLWITYDVWTGAYGALITHVTIFVFTVVGMILHDRKKKA